MLTLLNWKKISYAFYFSFQKRNINGFKKMANHMTLENKDRIVLILNETFRQYCSKIYAIATIIG